MELRKGFKHTEVGLIPEDWNAKRLSLVCTMKSGKGITNASIQKGEKYPCYGGNGLRGYTYSFTHEGSYPLIGRQGALCGNILGVKGRFFASEHAIVVTPSKETESNWLTYVLRCMNLNQYSESSAQPGLSVSKLLPLVIPVPPTKTEQTAIAIALNDVDAWIQSLSHLIAKKRQIKQGAMQTLLNPYDNGCLKKEWVVKELCEVADLATGNTPPTNDKSNYGGKFLFVSPADLGKGKWIADSEKKLSMKGFSMARKFPAHSILFTCIGSTIGKAGMALKELSSNQQINAVLPNSSFSSEYLYYFLVLIAPIIQASASEQAVPIINKTQFGETKIYIPTNKAEQTRIAKILSDMDNEITALGTKLAKAQQIKQGMMQNLLTGRIRLI